MSGPAQPSGSRPPQRVASTSSLSSVSVAPSSPGPSISLRAARSPTPGASSASGYASPVLGHGSSYLNAGGASSSRRYPSGTSKAMDSRDRSSSSSTRTASYYHNRRRPTLMGGGSKLGKGQLAQLSGAAGPSGMTSPPILSPPLLVVNGLERPEDVDISSIGRILPVYSNQQIQDANTPKGGYATPASTSAGVDALFSRFGVKEVRSISVRGAALAEGKREELRTMVGARYRDLLGAADSIVRMRRASSSLLGKLARARDECDREAMTARAQESDMTRSRVMLQRVSTPLADGGDSEMQGHTPYSIATLVKLLLDSPEHIWRYIEREDYLSAARLESIGRAVYRELASTRRSGRSTRMTEGPAGEAVIDGRIDNDSEDEQDDDDLLAAFPLMQNTGDMLDQLKPQIAERAKLHLRTWDAPIQSVAESLASIIMLDNASIPQVFDTLLQERSKTLSAVLSEDSATSGPPRRGSTLPISAIKASIAGMPLDATLQTDVEVEYAIQRVQEGLGIVLQTLEHAHSILAAHSGSEEGSKLLSLLSEIQQTPSAAPSSTDQPGSLYLATPSPAKAAFAPLCVENQVKLVPILNTLPNAPVLLRYLPSQILSFTPFIDTSSSRNTLSLTIVTEMLEQWFSSALSTLEAGITSLFATLQTASQLALLRQNLLEFLTARATAITWSPQSSRLQAALFKILESRFTEIYTTRLQSLTKLLPAVLETALAALESSGVHKDLTDFLLAPSAEAAGVYGSIPFSALNSSTTLSGNSRTYSSAVPSFITDLHPSRSSKAVQPFEAFRTAMRARVQGRSPILDACLCGIEAQGCEIRQDVTRWLEGRPGADDAVRTQYLEAVQASFVEMQQSLRQALDKQISEGSQLFLGNLALHMALRSSFLSNLALLDDPKADSLRPTREALLAIEGDSRTQWSERAVASSIAVLSAALDSAFHRPANPDTGKPAEYTLASLEVLLRAVRMLGSHRAQAVPDATKQLLATFENHILQDVLPGVISKIEALDAAQVAKKEALARQLHSDIAYLEEVLRVAGNGEQQVDSMSQDKSWREIESRLQKLANSQDAVKSAGGHQAFLRTQSLLSPILSSGYSSRTVQDNKGSPSLAFGAPIPVSANETKLFLAKPGPRFALLQVSQTAA